MLTEKTDPADTCTGQACDGIWKAQGEDDFAILKAIETSLGPTDTIGGDLGAKARKLSNSICSTNLTFIVFEAVQGRCAITARPTFGALRGSDWINVKSPQLAAPSAQTASL